MAGEIVITAANFQVTANTSTKLVQVGQATTAGQSLYLDKTVSKWKLADADNTAITAGADGLAIAAGNADSDGYCLIATGGTVDIGGTTAEGTVYVVGDVPGGIKPTASLASGDNTSLIGIGGPTNTIDLNFLVSGQTVP